MFTILEAGEREIFIQRVAHYTNESVEKIQELLPVWESIILGSSLILIRNRIRYNALNNFIQQKTVPTKEIEFIFTSPTSSVNWEKIIQYGEGLFGVLMPDKKSAIALLVSRELKCKSSLVVKGLSICFALYGNRLKYVDSANLKDWSAFGEYLFTQKHEFAALCPAKLQGQISEILLLNDFFRNESSTFQSNSDEFELSAVDDGASSTNWKIIGLILGSIMIASVIAWFVYVNMTKEEEVVNAETEEIIPIDSLAKLRDSLSKLSADSARIASDSLTHLSWPDGKAFDVPKNSALVPMFEYLTDTTNTESSELRVSEISFDEETNQLVSPFDAFFKKMVEGLNKYKDVHIRIYAFSENDAKSGLKRGFVVKNRLVGEGISPTRIDVKAAGNTVNPEASVPINSQILLVLSKKSVLK